MLSTTRVVDPNTIEYDLDEDVTSYYRQVVSPNLAYSLPLETSNGTYTLGESRDIWRGLAALSMEHALRCALSAELGTLNQASNSAVLRVPKSEFIARLSYYSQASEDRVSLILEDLIVAETGKRDLRATPLIASSGCILLMPHLVITLLWEASTAALGAKIQRRVRNAHHAPQDGPGEGVCRNTSRTAALS